LLLINSKPFVSAIITAAVNKPMPGTEQASLTDWLICALLLIAAVIQQALSLAVHLSF
jgi:hypothetical protein